MSVAMPGTDHDVYCLRPLWGGAARSEIPSSFVDVSDIRQVPDHQECWMDGGGGDGSGASAAESEAARNRERLLVFEILERNESVKDSDAARFYFQDLAEANGGDHLLASSSFVNVPPSSSSLMSRVVAPDGSCALSVGAGTQHVRMGRDYDYRGQPREGQEVRQVRVEIAVLRLPAQQTDLLITLTTPLGTMLDVGVMSDPTTLSEPFRRAVSTFDVLDWSLFGSSNP